MSDIVERLRGAASKDYGCQCVKCEAADEIERLRAELAAAKAELVRNAYELAAAIMQRDEAVELYTDLLRRLSASTPPRKEGGGA